MTTPIGAIGARPVAAAGGLTPTAGAGAPSPSAAAAGGDQADVSNEALQEGAASQNPEMKQQMQRMLNDSRLMQGVQAVHAEQQKGDKGDPQQALERLGQDYRQIKEKGGAISPNVEQEVQKTLGGKNQEQPSQEAGQGTPAGEGSPAGTEAPQQGEGQPSGSQPGGAPPAGGQPGGSPAGAPRSSGGPAPSGADSSPDAAPTQTATPPAELTGDDRRTADFINQYLRDKNSPAASQGTGEMMVRYGRDNNVDPLALLAIAGHETQFGRRGVGVNGMLGVGAYDSNPRNAVNNSRFSGVENQVRRGAETFNRLRARGGSSASDNLGNQLSAVNRAGWATDRNWHNGVARQYNQIAQAAQQYNATHPAPSAPAQSAPSQPARSAPSQPTRAASSGGDD